MKSLKTFLQMQERAFESRRALIAYLSSNPKRFTLENHVCLAGMLCKGGWKQEGHEWRKGQRKLSILDAAKIQAEEDIDSIRAKVLRKTVKASETVISFD